MNDPVSVIEDLTPEPPDRPGIGRGRDLALGMLLIMLVVGFAGWQWWQQEKQASSYEAGQNAIAIHDWEAARDHFTAASGYRDADALAVRATEEIQRREQLHEQALAFARDENWIAAMHTLEQLGKDRLDYQGLESLWDEVQVRTYKDALSGTVVLRSGNGEAGLYVITGDRSRESGKWYWLLNSDSYSRVQGGCTDGKVLYDVPGSDWIPQPTPIPSPFFITDSREKLEGRVLMAYDPNRPATLEYFRLSIDPSAYDLYLCGRTGMWLYDYGLRGFAGRMPGLDDTPVRDVDTGYALSYVSFDGAISATLTFADRGDARELPLSIDYGSNRLLLARWSGEDNVRGLITEETVVELYLVELDGVSAPRLIYQARGSGLQSAEISQDSRYALVSTFTPMEGAGPSQEVEKLLLVDIDNPTDPKLLAETVARFDTYLHNWLSSTFVREGPYAGNVIRTRFDGRSAIIVSVIDPATSTTLTDAVVTAFTTGTGRVSPMIWTIAQEDEKGLVLVGYQGIRDGLTLVGWSLSVVSISPEGEVKLTRDTTKAGYLRAYPFVIAEGRLNYVTDFSNKNADWTVWSLPLSEPAYDAVYSASSEIYSVHYPVPRTFLPYDKVGFGPGLIVHIENEKLHARSYDGKYDVVLEEKVLALYDSWRYWWYDNELR